MKEIFAEDLSELVGKKLVGVDGDYFCLQLMFEDGTILDIEGNDGWDYPASLDLELRYAHSDDKEVEKVVG